MALFDQRPAREDEELIASSDAATRALSVAVVENDFVEGVYDKLASVYDLIFGPTLHPGRVRAIQRMDIRPGTRVLEVGVGTGINLLLYPHDCRVTGIDFSASMLERARERVFRKGVNNARLLQMDAQDLKFPDDTFDIVYAPYLISVVPDPVKVACEMRRVCRPGGRLIFLNHFLSPGFLLSRTERLISPFTVHIGFKADLDLTAFLAQAGLQPVSIEKVNVPRIWSLVTCVKDQPA
jgi:phosphatidylethanolamine/phosphatidyl-N-methylethanolamine N-methyltransferase